MKKISCQNSPKVGEVCQMVQKIHQYPVISGDIVTGSSEQVDVELQKTPTGFELGPLYLIVRGGL